MDTLHLPSVSIYRTPLGNGLWGGTKSERIDSLALTEKRHLSLAELLHENSPLFVKSYGRGSMATVSLRGTGASHTKVIWNGIEMNSPMTGETDLALVPLILTDDITIHFGQAALIYGAGGIGGAISLRSKPEWDREFGLEVLQSLGSYSTVSSAVSTSYGRNKFRGQTRVYWESSQNNFSFSNTALIDSPSEVQQNADYTRMGVLQEAYFRPSERDIVSARIWMQQGDRGIPKLMTSFWVDEVNRQQDNSLLAGVEWAHFTPRLKWKLHSGVSNLQLDYRLSKNTPLGITLPVVSSNSIAWSISNGLVLEGNPLRRVTLGASLFNALHSVKSNENVIGSGYRGTMHELSLRMHVAVEATRSLTVTGIVIQDLYDYSLSPIIPSISFKYNILSKHTININGALGRNFSRPSLNDLYWQPGGNPNLLPEEGLQGEMGISYRTPSERVWLGADAHVFRSRISNWIVWLPHLKGYWEPLNIPEVDSKGGELNATLGLAFSRFRYRLSGRYSHTRTTVSESGNWPSSSVGKQLPFIPIHSAGVTADIHYRDLYIIYSFTHFSERFTTTSNNPNSFRNLYPYYMSAVSVGSNINFRNIKSSVQIRIDNLLNEKYQTILWRPMPGRNYTVTLRVNL